LGIPADSQGVHVYRTCRRPELVTGFNARIYGTPEHYDKHRTNCDSWEFDVDYYKSVLETDPLTAKAYFNNCVESRMCELCIWNDGESCTFNEANPVTSESGTVAT
jgi:hypothetical protein